MHAHAQRRPRAAPRRAHRRLRGGADCRDNGTAAQPHPVVRDACHVPRGAEDLCAVDNDEHRVRNAAGAGGVDQGTYECSVKFCTHVLSEF